MTVGTFLHLFLSFGFVNYYPGTTIVEMGVTLARLIDYSIFFSWIVPKVLLLEFFNIFTNIIPIVPEIGLGLMRY